MLICMHDFCWILGLVFGAVDDQKQAGLFGAALDNSPGSVNIFSQTIGNYYVRRGMFSEALPYLEKAYQFYPREYSVNFELLLAHIVTNNSQAAFPYFSALVGSQKNLFLADYAQIKTMFPQYDRQFESFESFVKNAQHSS